MQNNTILDEGKNLYSQKQYKKALAFFLGLPSDSAADKIEVSYYLGLCYTKLERYDDALLFLEQVVTSGGNFERVLQCRFLLAVIYALSGRKRLADFELNKLLDTGYGIVCDRRSVKNNIDALIEAGYDIVYDVGYYLASREFDEAELRMMIDSVLFSKTIPVSASKSLLKKLSSMGSKYFRPKVSHISVAAEVQHSDNKLVMYSVDTINDAIQASVRNWIS